MKTPASSAGPLPWGMLAAMTLQGALLAGIYGMVHDQVTYSISHEYFTGLKFEQFRYADFGWPTRWHVAEIGFLATWWVGFFSGWILTRSVVRRLPAAEVPRRVRQAFALVFVSAALGGLAGYGLGGLTLYGAGLAAWASWGEVGISDVRSFALVAFIHEGGYLGGLAGLIGGLFFLRRRAVWMGAAPRFRA